MLKASTALILAAALVSGCSGMGTLKAPPQTKYERAAQVQAASAALRAGNYHQAEQLLADYMYRDDSGELRFKFLRFTPEGKKQAVDTVAMLLWETGRDQSLADFASRYLHGYERDVMLCRLAERKAEFEDAYQCWNDLGDIDRARRSVRTESALRILKD